MVEKAKTKVKGPVVVPGRPKGASVMTAEREILENALSHALSGTGAHVETETVFAGLDWKLSAARPDNAPHSVYQLLDHMRYWQDWVLSWLEGCAPPIPRHAAGSWPREAGPANQKEWDQAVRRFRGGLKTLDRRSREGNLFSRGEAKSRLEMVQAIASHNSYHAGQVVVLRQVIGAWPPPSGGLTW